MFVTIENFKKLHSVLRKFFKEKYGLELDALSDVIDIQRMMFEIMKKVTRGLPSASVDEQNKVVLKEAKENLLRVYQHLNEEAARQRMMEQQRIMASQRPLPDAPVVYENDVNADFAVISQARQLEQQMMPNGSDMTQALDNAFDDDEFHARLRTLEARRLGESPVDTGRRELVMVVCSADRDMTSYPSPHTFGLDINLSSGSAISIEEIILPIPHKRPPIPLVTVLSPELFGGNITVKSGTAIASLTLDHVASGLAVYRPSGRISNTILVPTINFLTFDIRDGSGNKVAQTCDGVTLIEVTRDDHVKLSTTWGMEPGDVLRFGGVAQLEGADFVIHDVKPDNQVVLDVDEKLKECLPTSGWVMNATRQVTLTLRVK